MRRLLPLPTHKHLKNTNMLEGNCWELPRLGKVGVNRRKMAIEKKTSGFEIGTEVTQGPDPSGQTLTKLEPAR